jgi:6-phosphofructo-2-kinase
MDKLHYRYRGNGGESYLDVVFRLQGVIIEIERLQTHVLLIAHRVVERILLAYYLNLSHQVQSHSSDAAEISRISLISKHQ